MSYDFSHVDPDLVPILTDLDARLKAIVIPPPVPVDLGPLTAQLAATNARIDTLAQSSIAANATLTQNIAALDARIKAIPAPTPPFDASTINATLAALTTRVAALEAGIPPPPPPPVDHPPVWLTVPPVQFSQGKAGVFSFAGLASDPDGDPLTFTFSGSLPSGVTFDGPGKRLVYDGIGAVAATSGNFLVADDGRA